MDTEEKKGWALFPGSFDPFHTGHLHVLTTALERYEHVTVLIGRNDAKEGMMSYDNRKAYIMKSVENLGDRVDVVVYEGFIAEWLASQSRTYEAIVKGYRNDIDLHYEERQEEVNRFLSHELDGERYPKGIPTYYVNTGLTPKRIVSSSLIRDIIYRMTDGGEPRLWYVLAQMLPIPTQIKVFVNRGTRERNFRMSIGKVEFEGYTTGNIEAKTHFYINQ